MTRVPRGTLGTRGKEEDFCMIAKMRPKSWEEILDIGRLLNFYIFRGQKNAEWTLKSGLERACDEYRIPVEGRNHSEKRIIEEFKRRAHHYVASPPDDDFEWLALLQHHGGVTRLLDFSHSFYVAAFFAMENATSDGAVWGIEVGPFNDRLWVTDEKKRLYLEEQEHRLTVELPDSNEKRVIMREPRRMNERLSVQQGLFLFPCNITVPFMDCLAAWVKDDLTDATVIDPTELRKLITDHKSPLVIKIIIPRNTHTEGLEDLARMNVTAASLFPGLDGFARSLMTKMRFWEKEIWKKFPA
jgi:hypothetical protein